MFLHKFLKSNKEKWVIIRHLFIGGTGVILNYIFFQILFKIIHLNVFFSTVVTHILLIIIIFPLQKRFTFFSNGIFKKEFLKFVINDLLYISLDYTFSWIFIIYFGMGSYTGKALALFVLTPISYIIQRHWVFKERTIKNYDVEV